ncbi:MAG: EamA family transporter [Segetibacter sp.]|nr:EamA family transporter [Segetibacter sp.]
MSNTRKAHAAVLATNILFASNYSIIKFITPSVVKPFGLNVVRVLGCIVLFWAVYLLKPSAAAIQKKHIPRFFLCAATGIAINQTFFTKGLSLTMPIHASLLMLACPIFITFIAAWLLREVITFKKILGLMIGIAGSVILISIKENSSGGSDILLGDLMILVNAVSYGFYMVIVRPLMEAYSPIHVMRWVFTLGAIMILPFGWQQFMEVDWPALHPKEVAAIIYIVIGGTFLAYFLNIYGINHLGASATGAYIYTQPVFAAIIAVVFLGEHFSWQMGIAALLIFTGVFLVNMKRREDGA